MNGTSSETSETEIQFDENGEPIPQPDQQQQQPAVSDEIEVVKDDDDEEFKVTTAPKKKSITKKEFKPVSKSN
jgi:hypothetical protein